MASILDTIQAQFPAGATPPETPAAGGFDLMGFLRALMADPLTKVTREPGGLGSSKLDRRGPDFGVPQDQYLATGARPAASAAVTPAPVATPAAGTKPVVPGAAAPSTPLAPKTPEQIELDRIEMMKKQHDMFRGLVPRPAPPILGSRG